MPEQLLTASKAAAEQAAVTMRACPFCHGDGKYPRTCGMCANAKLVAICPKCGGAGTDVTQASRGIVGHCTACLGRGIVLPRKLYTRLLKKMGGLEAVALGRRVGA